MQRKKGGRITPKGTKNYKHTANTAKVRETSKRLAIMVRKPLPPEAQATLAGAIAQAAAQGRHG